MSRKFRVAIILINFNSSSHTIHCVESINKLTSNEIRYQIVVVDNNSAPTDFKNLDLIRNTKNLKIIRSRINTGFSTGCMIGVQNSDADYYFFLNNDCILLNDCVSILTKFMDENQQASICSPQLFSQNGTAITSFNYRPDFLSKLLGNYIFKITRKSSYFSRKTVPQVPIRVEVLSGAQLFARATDFEELGGFDTTLFLYCEEEDLAIRAYKNGKQLWLVPDAHNSHIGGASTKPSIEITHEFLISFFYIYEKHYGKTKTILLRFIYILRYLRKSFKDPKKFGLAWSILKGCHMKHSLRHRQKISYTHFDAESCKSIFDNLS